MMSPAKEKGGKQKIEQSKIGGSASATIIKDESSKGIHIETVEKMNVVFTSPEKNFRGIRHYAKNLDSEKEELEKGKGIFSFDKPVLKNTIDFNDLTPSVLDLIQKYRKIFDFLNERDRAVFVCACRIIAAEDEFTKINHVGDKEKELRDFGKIEALRKEAELNYMERYNRTYNRLRSGFIISKIPELREMMRKYKGNRLKNVLNSKWGEWLTKSPNDIFPNEFTTEKSLVEGLKKRFYYGSSRVNVHVKGNDIISKTNGTLKREFSTGYNVEPKKRPKIAKMQAVKFVVTKE